MFLTLATKSLKSRRGSVLLSLLALIVSILVLLGVENVRKQTKESFASTISGVDLIVGARTGDLNLLLYSVFRIGAPTNNIGWQSYEVLAANDSISWAIPISLGDSHKGYRVLGTTAAYFEHFKYGKARPLRFAKGRSFDSYSEIVLGHEVAKKLGYAVGDKLILAHGIGAESFSLHENRPFTVLGILEPTGTPVDQTLHVSLQGIEAIHHNWQPGQSAQPTQKEHSSLDALQPQEVTAILLGLKSKLSTFNVQRDIREFSAEPLTAILPGVALSELWQIMGVLENSLRIVSALVMSSALLGLAAMLLASIRERRQEIHLLRALGASPMFLFLLIQLEALLISCIGYVIAIGLLATALWASRELLLSEFGIALSPNVLTPDNLMFLLIILLATSAVAAIPSWRAYREAKHL